MRARGKNIDNGDYNIEGWQLVSPASLLDSQHGCIASLHAKKESGRRFGLALSANVAALPAKMNKTTPHNNQIHFLVQEIPGPVETKPPTEFDQTPSSRAVMQYIRAVNQGGWLARLGGSNVKFHPLPSYPRASSHFPPFSHSLPL